MRKGKYIEICSSKVIKKLSPLNVVLFLILYLLFRNEPPTHVKDVLNDANVTLQKRGIGSIGDISTAGLDDLIKRSKWPG